MNTDEITRLTRHLVYLTVVNSASNTEYFSIEKLNADKKLMIEEMINKFLIFCGSSLGTTASIEEGNVVQKIQNRLLKEKEASTFYRFSDLYQKYSSVSQGYLKSSAQILHCLDIISKTKSQKNIVSKLQTFSLPFNPNQVGTSSKSSNPISVSSLTQTQLQSKSKSKSTAGSTVSQETSAQYKYEFSHPINFDILSDSFSTVDINTKEIKDEDTSTLDIMDERIQNNSIFFVQNNDAIALSRKEFFDFMEKSNEIAEEEIVKDVLYACQGIDGKFIKYDDSINAYALSETYEVHVSIRKQVTQLCEIASLHKQILNTVNSFLKVESEQKIGKIAQAFYSFIQKDLIEYYRLLATLFSNSHQPIPFFTHHSNENEKENEKELMKSSNYLSIQRLFIWLYHPLIRMKFIHELIEECSHHQGGALINAIFLNNYKNDPVLKKISENILRHVSQPLFDWIRFWILQGNFHDPHHEFFVFIDSSVNEDLVWSEGYKLQFDMIPSFISSNLANQILRIGKSINFLQKCCHDQKWMKEVNFAIQNFDSKTNYSNLNELINDVKKMVFLVSERIDKYLIKIMYDQFHLLSHFQAFKKYLLFGQGDFIQVLMDEIQSELYAPVNKLSLFNLSSILISAIRSSNAQFEENEIIDRLHVHFIPSSRESLGWEVFTLNYAVNSPLTSVFTQHAMSTYLSLFNFLWRLKRVEHSLTATWQLLKPDFHRLIFGKETKTDVISKFSQESRRNGDEEEQEEGGDGREGKGGRGEWRGEKEKEMVKKIVKKCQLFRRELCIFVFDVQYYVMLEAIETHWIKFYAIAEKAKCLDDLIHAHENYLKSIKEMAMVDDSSSLKTILLKLFDAILTFCSSIKRIHQTLHSLLPKKKVLNMDKEANNTMESWKALTKLNMEVDDTILLYKQLHSSLVHAIKGAKNGELESLLSRVIFTSD